MVVDIFVFSCIISQYGLIDIDIPEQNLKRLGGFV